MGGERQQPGVTLVPGCYQFEADARLRDAGVQTPIGPQMVRDARSQAGQASALVAGTPNLQMLLVTNQPLSKAAQAEIDAARPGVSVPLTHVLVRDAGDSAKLELAVQRALGLRN